MGTGTGGNGVYPTSPRDAMETGSHLTRLPSVTAFPGKMGKHKEKGAAQAVAE